MSLRYFNSKSLVISKLYSLIPLLSFIALLQLRISSSLTVFFKWYSPLLFISLFIVFFLAFKLQGKAMWIVVGSITMGIFALTLSYNWSSGYSDNAILGGLVPYKDGFYYYNGARLILDGNPLPLHSVQAANRPLFTGFLATALLLTSQNLQIVLALLVGLTAHCCFSAAIGIYRFFGQAAAALFLTLSYLFIQPLLGDTVSEPLGLSIGCLGFVVLINAAHKGEFRLANVGIFITLAAVYLRAGTFFIIPMLILWAAWYFRKAGQSPLRKGLASLGIVLISFFLLHSVFSKLINEPGIQPNNNFAYTIYGQVMGGTGYNRASQDLGTKSASVIFSAAYAEFLEHPLSLILGAAKSYRDFFFPGRIGVFSFHTPQGNTLVDSFLWVSSLLLLFFGLYSSWKDRSSGIHSLLLASAVGIFLSIPFLPPIDGGRRFYASTMPFFFALPAAGLKGLVPGLSGSEKSGIRFTSSLPIAIASMLIVAATIAPLIILQASSPTFPSPPICPSNQTAFAIIMNSGDYVDIVANEEQSCGYSPDICLEDFEKNGIEKSVDPFYQSILSTVYEQNSSIRLMPANNLLDNRFYFFLGEPSIFELSPPDRILRGCAEFSKSPPTLYVISRVAGYADTEP